MKTIKKIIKNHEAFEKDLSNLNAELSKKIRETEIKANKYLNTLNKIERLFFSDTIIYADSEIYKTKLKAILSEITNHK